MRLIRKSWSILSQQGPKALLGRAGERLLLDAIALLSRPLVKSTADDPFHLNAHFLNAHFFAEQVQQMREYNLLELGSREAETDLGLRGYRKKVGVDIHPGPNVDVVGDIHALSRLLDEKFDAVYTISTFEHLAMPWKAVLEINRVMNVGGLLLIVTHPTWPPHALPWDFWRFPAGAFRVLLNPQTGFEILRLDEGLPCVLLPLGTEKSTREMHRGRANMGVSVVARKTGEPKPGLCWNVGVDEILTTVYPPDFQPRHRSEGN